MTGPFNGAPLPSKGEVKMTVSVMLSVTDQPDRHLVVSDTALNAVLFDFNPAANDDVTIIKALHAALISKMEAIRAAATPAGARCAAIAITELEGAQMRSVKALYAK